MTNVIDSIKIDTIDPGDSKALECFLQIHDTHYSNVTDYYPQTDQHRAIIHYYRQRPDYRFVLLTSTENEDNPARCMVGSCKLWPWAFFGLFECPENDDIFNALMKMACQIAQRYGKHRLLGPIDFNGIHNWQFLSWSQQTKHWVGDPFHHSYYVDLFSRNNWQITDESVSGMIKPEHHPAFVRRLHELQQRIESAGHLFVTRQDFSNNEWIQQIWSLTNRNFATEMLKYNPIDQSFFQQINQPLLAMLNNPYNLIGTCKKGKLTSFMLSYANFIDVILKRPSTHQSTKPPYFGVKTVAVDKAYQSTPILSVLVKAIACHCQEIYGHSMGWRRSNLNNPGTQRTQRISQITQRYCAFNKEVYSE